jgi:uncharacterized protein
VAPPRHSKRSCPYEICFSRAPQPSTFETTDPHLIELATPGTWNDNNLADELSHSRKIAYNDSDRRATTNMWTTSWRRKPPAEKLRLGICQADCPECAHRDSTAPSWLRFSDRRETRQVRWDLHKINSQNFLAALGRRDKQGLLALSAEDIEGIIPAEDWPLAGTHRGHPGLENLLQKANETLETSYPEPPAFIAQGDQVLVVGFASRRIKATNRTFEDHWVFDITVRNGKLTTVREYIDTQALARASEIDASPKP